MRIVCNTNTCNVYTSMEHHFILILRKWDIILGIDCTLYWQFDNFTEIIKILQTEKMSNYGKFSLI